MDILILDDSKVAHKEFESAISSLNIEINTIYCFTYNDAINVINNQPIDVAFIDLQMPGLNGADLIVNLRASEEHKNLKLVVLTGTGENTLLKTSLISQVDAYLHKGGGVDPIKKVLENFLNRTIEVDMEILNNEYGNYLNEVFAIYKEENDETFRSLTVALLEDDFPTLTFCIHKMKGSARIIRDFDLVALCEEMEADLKQGKLDQHRVNEFISHYKGLSSYIAHYVKAS